MPDVRPVAPASITFSCPLPPVSLRANSRAHWSKKKRDADAYSERVYAAWCADPNHQYNLGMPWFPHEPWTEAHVVYTWRYCDVAPDHGNLGGNTKYLQDCLQMAPKSGAGQHRFYLGIVEDDSGLTCEYRAVKVPHRKDERVEVEVTRCP